MTQEFPLPTLSYLQAVKSGIDPIVKCLEVLDKAKFTVEGGNALANRSDELSLKVLNTMHNLHYSWFSSRVFFDIAGRSVSNMGSFLDTSSPALFYTKSLFDPAYNFKNIFSGEITYRASRVVKDPSVSPHGANITKANDIITSNTMFADTGKLQGMSVLARNSSLSYAFNTKDDGSGTDESGSAIYNSSWGGGVLGSQTYMLQNSSASSLNNYKPNGALIVNRQWAINVLNDFMCRELPAVRDSDVSSFVVSRSNTPFRQSVGCVKCHATMDRLAGITRNIQYNRIGTFHLNTLAPLVKRTATQGAANIFPSEADKNYYLRPSTGHLYFRSYSGSLINLPLSSVGDFGQKLMSLEDPYICVAKKYYEYFTGISAEIGDINDISHSRYKRMSTQELKYRNKVIELGKNLKTHQKLRQLIKEIISSAEFKSNDYGVGAK